MSDQWITPTEPYTDRDNDGPGADERLPVGSFRFWYADRRWEWSDEIYRMFGYEPGTITPTAELLRSHRHPDDAVEIGDILLAKSVGEQPVSGHYRFLDVDGRVHDVIVVADRPRDVSGPGTGTFGCFVDLTELVAR
ncbi:PAS domain-containing protein, partial [Nocardia gipuzkoensis]